MTFDDIISKKSSASDSLLPNDLIATETKTNWRGIFVAGTIMFIGTFEMILVLMIEWPYMHKIDPEATSNFYGFSAASSKIIRVVFVMIFSYWTYKTHSVKKQLIVGRILALIGCILFLTVEFLSNDRRYQLLISGYVFAAARSSTAVLRVYIVLMSQEEDRSKAFSLVSASTTLSLILAPLAQLAFSIIPHPGIILIPGLHINLFTASIWLATLTQIIFILAVMFALPEMPPKKKVECEDDDDLNQFSLTSLRNRWNQVKSLKVPWILVAVCLTVRLAMAIPMMAYDVIYAPLMMAIYGWDSEYMVFHSSTVCTIYGVLASTVCGLYMTTKLGAWIPPRPSLVISIVLSLSLYFAAYPWPITRQPVPAYNETTGVGCNPKEYTWCETATAAKPQFFIPFMILTAGFGSVMGSIALETVYSKILRAVDQSIMQAVAVVVDDVASIIAPIYATNTFTTFGQSALYVTNGSFIVIAGLLWALFYRRLKPFE